jgi:hypothetical protein
MPCAPSGRNRMRGVEEEEEVVVVMMWTWKIHFSIFSSLTSVSSVYQLSSAY